MPPRSLCLLSDAASVSTQHLPPHPGGDRFRAALLALIPASALSESFREALINFHQVLVGGALPPLAAFRSPALCVIREAEALYAGKEDDVEYTRFVSKLRRHIDAVIHSVPRIPGESDSALHTRKGGMHAAKEVFFRTARNHKQRASRVERSVVLVTRRCSCPPLQGCCSGWPAKL